MDERMSEKTSAPAVKARKGHIILFVIACVLFAGTLLCLGEFADLVRLANDSPDDAQLPGAEFFIGLGLLLVGYAVIAVFAVCWGGCQVMSIILVSQKEDKPRWMWVTSLALIIVNGACAVGMTVMVVMVGKWFF